MRVLMFGWEFPPHIAGGLGTACYGIVKGLAHNGVQTMFVMPSASGDEDRSAADIINASEIPVDVSSTMNVDDFLDKVQFVHIGTNMVPYLDPAEFHSLVEEDRKRQVRDFSIHYGQTYKFSGKYGSNLMEEVARYAMVGGTIAMTHKGEFDVIHAHDWLTYMAGIAAKRLSGKPLVVHVHATSFDRSSDNNIDTRVYDIEKRGMEAADRVITVSDLTRNIVITKYGIDPSKVVTVHNAVDFSGRSEIQVERGVKEKVVTFLGRITFQKGPEYFIEAAAKILKKCKFRHGRQRRYDEPLNPPGGKTRNFRQVPFHRIPARSRGPENVRIVRCIRDAVGFRAVRYFSSGSHALRSAVGNLQTVRCCRGPEICFQGGLLGCGCHGR